MKAGKIVRQVRAGERKLMRQMKACESKLGKAEQVRRQVKAGERQPASKGEAEVGKVRQVRGQELSDCSFSPRPPDGGAKFN